MHKKIVSLTVHKNTLEKRQRKAIRESLAETVRETAPDIDGYVLLTYKKTGEQIQSRVNFHVRDTMDVYALPDMAKQEILRRVR